MVARSGVEDVPAATEHGSILSRARLKMSEVLLKKWCKMVSDVCQEVCWGRWGGRPGSSEAPGLIWIDFPDEIPPSKWYHFWA